MTAPDTGSSRTGRLAGFALLGLAVVALVMGLVTAFGGNGEPNADGNDNERPPRPPSSTSRTTTSGDQTTTRPPASGSSSVTAPPATTTPPTQPPPGGDGNGEAPKSTPLHVLNNSKVSGLAADAAEDFRAQGWQVTDVGNYSATNVPTTTAYYRPGTEEEAAAKSLAAAFGLDTAPRLDTIKNLPAGVVVIVTGDYGNATGSDGDKDQG